MALRAVRLDAAPYPDVPWNRDKLRTRPIIGIQKLPLCNLFLAIIILVENTRNSNVALELRYNSITLSSFALGFFPAIGHCQRISFAGKQIIGGNANAMHKTNFDGRQEFFKN